MQVERSSLGVFGAGYVGLVTAACFAELGRTVVLCDIDPVRIGQLRAGELPIHEPGLGELVAAAVRAGRLRFTSEPADAVRGCGVVFICVGTPSARDGHADLTGVRAAATAIALALDGPTVIVNKSTVPVETGDLVAAIVREERTVRHDAVVVSNPEFLREGSAVYDFMHPDRIVIGCADPGAEAVLRDLYAPLDAPVLVTDVRTAEMVKYTANAFLATKISFINEIAAICERVGADVRVVAAGAGSDRRIGTAFFNAGLGFGGSCLPKDVAALLRVAEDAAVDAPLLDAVLVVNERAVERIVARLGYLLDGVRGRCIGVLGAAFKAGTDDVRDSPALALVEALLAAGAEVRLHDPVALGGARRRFGERITYRDDPHDAAHGADALAIATEWPAYRALDLQLLREAMRRRVIVDCRNLLDPLAVAKAGFYYAGVGRGTPRPVLVHDVA